jgi:hypothetical protein
MCLCTGMLYDPKKEIKEEPKEVKESRFKKLKQKFLKKNKNVKQ